MEPLPAAGLEKEGVKARQILRGCCPGQVESHPVKVVARVFSGSWSVGGERGVGVLAPRAPEKQGIAMCRRQ